MTALITKVYEAFLSVIQASYICLDALLMMVLAQSLKLVVEMRYIPQSTVESKQQRYFSCYFIVLQQKVFSLYILSTILVPKACNFCRPKLSFPTSFQKSIFNFRISWISIERQSLFVSYQRPQMYYLTKGFQTFFFSRKSAIRASHLSLLRKGKQEAGRHLSRKQQAVSTCSRLRQNSMQQAHRCSSSREPRRRIRFSNICCKQNQLLSEYSAFLQQQVRNMHWRLCSCRRALLKAGLWKSYRSISIQRAMILGSLIFSSYKDLIAFILIYNTVRLRNPTVTPSTTTHTTLDYIEIEGSRIFIVLIASIIANPIKYCRLSELFQKNRLLQIARQKPREAKAINTNCY